jgi:hypothetical protein
MAVSPEGRVRRTDGLGGDAVLCAEEALGVWGERRRLEPPRGTRDPGTEWRSSSAAEPSLHSEESSRERRPPLDAGKSPKE